MTFNSNLIYNKNAKLLLKTITVLRIFSLSNIYGPPMTIFASASVYASAGDVTPLPLSLAVASLRTTNDISDTMAAVMASVA